MGTLIKDKYIEPVKDTKGNDSCTGYVRAMKEASGDYKYTTCLVCDDYRSENEECNDSYDPSQNDSIYALKVPSKVYSYYHLPINEQKIEKATLTARGTEVKKVTADAATFKVVKYSYSGPELEGKTLSGAADIEIYQNAAPNVKLEKINTSGSSLGTYVSNTWTNQNVKETFSSVAYREGKVYKYQVASSVSGPWTDYCTSLDSTGKCSRTISTSTNYNQIKYIRALDQEGRISAISSYQVKIDKVAPTCSSASGSSTTWTSGNRSIYQYCSDSDSGCTSSYTYQNYSTTTKTSSIMIYDNVGNSRSCPVNVYVDKTAPSCSSVSGASTSWTASNRTIYQYCTDSHSGCRQSSFNQTYSSGTTTTSSIMIYDNVGNSRSCPVNVYVDKTAPSCGSVSGASTSWTSGNRYITVGCSDSGSGCTSNPFGYTFSSSAYSSNINIKDRVGNNRNCSVNVYIDKRADLTVDLAAQKAITTKQDNLPVFPTNKGGSFNKTSVPARCPSGTARADCDSVGVTENYVGVACMNTSAHGGWQFKMLSYTDGSGWSSWSIQKKEKYDRNNNPSSSSNHRLINYYQFTSKAGKASNVIRFDVTYRLSCGY